MLPQGEAEEVLEIAADREKVGVAVEVLVDDTDAVLVEVDFPAAPTPEALGLLEEEEVLVPSPEMDIREEEEDVLEIVEVLVEVIVEVVVLVVVEEGEDKEDALTDLLKVVVLVAVLLEVLVALFATCRPRMLAGSSLGQLDVALCATSKSRTPRKAGCSLGSGKSAAPAQPLGTLTPPSSARATRAIIPIQQRRRRRKGRGDMAAIRSLGCSVGGWATAKRTDEQT